MNIITVFKKHKRFIRCTAVIGLLVLVFGLLAAGGQYYFQDQKDEIARDEFLDKFKNFYDSMLQYLYQPPIVLGICVVLLFYMWISIRLLDKYFNMFKPGRFADIFLNPRALESIPHSLLVLFIYFAFLMHVHSLRFIMLVSFALVSIPFIYKILEDVFITADKEGVVENYLVLPITDWHIVQSFWKPRLNRLFIIPFIFFIILVVYWEFLYSSIGITGDETSAPGVFYNNYNDSYLINFPIPHSYLILFQIGLFASAVGILLYIVHMMRGNDLGGVTELKKKKQSIIKSHDNNVLVSCRNLTIGSLSGKTGTQEKQETIIINNINLDIKKGENICIMGESGSGKTTLAREIAGIRTKGLEIKNGVITHGTNSIFTVFQDVDLYLDPYQTLYYYIELAFKKRNLNNNKNKSHKSPGIDNRLLVQTINEIGLLKPLLGDQDQGVDSQQINHALENNRHQKINEIAGLLVKGLKTKTKQRLSGGEKQKFFLLIAFIVEPDIIIADEIFTDVDSASVEKIVSLLFKKNLNVVFISHDIGMIKELMDKELLQKVFYLNHKQLHQDVWAYPPGNMGGEEFMPQWAKSMWKAYQNILAEEVKSSRGKIQDSPVVFEFNNVTREFADHRKITFSRENTPLTIRKGINYALLGENGSGKTTLFKILTKVSGYKGKITYWDEKPRELHRVSRYNCTRKNQLVFQKTGNAIVEDIIIKDYLLSFFNKSEHQTYQQKIKDLIAQFFSKEKTGQIMNSSFQTLSVGEQRRILLIRSLLLVSSDGILFVDEAMRGMDVFLKERLIKYLKNEKLQVFLISHDKHLVNALCQEKIRLTYNKKTRKTMIKNLDL